MSQQIEGLPRGTKVVAIKDSAKEGEYRLTGANRFERVSRDYPFASAILAPDNAYNVVDLATVPVPEGEKLLGGKVVFAVPEPTGRFISENGKAYTRSGMPWDTDSSSDARRILLEPRRKRRFLITSEREIDGCGTVEAMTILQSGELSRCMILAQSMVALRPDIYRIEERD